MNWRQTISRFFSERGRLIVPAGEGIGVEFGDGCDVCWLLPDEPLTTLPIPVKDEGIARTIELIRHIDDARAGALHILRHYLASLRIRVRDFRSGAWGIEFEDGSSSSLYVGAYLTHLAAGGAGAADLVRACLTDSVIRRAPSPKRMARYLAIEGPPAPLALPQEQTQRPHSIRHVLRWMGVCHALSNDQALASPEALTKAAAPDGPLAKMYLRLAERLPDVEASMGLTSTGMLLRFSDGEAWHTIETKSRELAAALRAQGPEAAGDALADEYLSLDDGRRRVLAAACRAARIRGWKVDRYKVGLADVRRWYFGAGIREVGVDSGDALTQALCGRPPAEAVTIWLVEHPQFASECAKELDRGDATDDAIEEATLAPHPPSSSPRLCDLDGPTVERMNRFAEETIAALLRSREALRTYNDPDMYDRGRDTWASSEDWRRVAEAQLSDEWVDTAALRILIDLGDPRAPALARRYLEKATPHHEVGEGEVEVVWRHRREYPGKAREWFGAKSFDEVPYAKTRRRLGDPIARRFCEVEEAESQRRQDAQEEQARLVTWARTNWVWSPAPHEELRDALRLGMADVAEALEENPHLLSGLLTGENRGEMMDEPGILLSRDFLLVWSRLNPTPLLARLIATALRSDVVEQAKQVAREAARRKPQLRAGLDMTFTAYEQWMEQLKPALAIAWRRCVDRLMGSS